MNVFTCNNVSIKRKDLTTCRTAKKKSFATLAFAKQILRRLSLETDAGSSHEDHCDPSADTHLHKSKWLGMLQLASKCVKIKGSYLECLVVEKESGGSASLLVRCSFAPFWVEGEIFLGHRFFSSFFGYVCVLERNNGKRGIGRSLLLNLIIGVLSDQLFSLPTEATSFNRQIPPTQDWF